MYSVGRREITQGSLIKFLRDKIEQYMTPKGDVITKVDM